MSADLRIETSPRYPEQTWVISHGGVDIVRSTSGSYIHLSALNGQWRMKTQHPCGSAHIELLPAQMRTLAAALILAAEHAEATGAAAEGKAA